MTSSQASSTSGSRKILYQSIEQGQPVKLQLDQHQHPTRDQAIQRPPTQEKPDLIHAASPGGGKL